MIHMQPNRKEMASGPNPLDLVSVCKLKTRQLLVVVREKTAQGLKLISYVHGDGRDRAALCDPDKGVEDTKLMISCFPFKIYYGRKTARLEYVDCIRIRSVQQGPLYGC